MREAFARAPWQLLGSVEATLELVEDARRLAAAAMTAVVNRLPPVWEALTKIVKAHRFVEV